MLLKNSEILVSIIIPIFNTQEFLSECLDSIIHQSYQYLDIILIDDGSTDNCLQICQNYQMDDQRIRVFTQANHGLSHARNVGIANSEGEYLYFTDSDDVLDLKVIELLVKKIESKGFDFVFFDFQKIDLRNRQGSTLNCKRYRANINLDSINQEKWFEYLVATGCYHTQVWTLFIRRTHIIKNNLTFKEGLVYEDSYFTYALFLSTAKIGYLREILYYHRYNPNSITNGPQNINCLVSISEVFRFFCSVQQSNKAVDINRLIKGALMNEIRIYRQLSKKEKKLVNERYQKDKTSVKDFACYRNSDLFLACNNIYLYYWYRRCRSWLKHCFFR